MSHNYAVMVVAVAATAIVIEDVDDKYIDGSSTFSTVLS